MTLGRYGATLAAICMLSTGAVVGQGLLPDHGAAGLSDATELWYGEIGSLPLRCRDVISEDGLRDRFVRIGERLRCGAVSQPRLAVAAEEHILPGLADNAHLRGTRLRDRSSRPGSSGIHGSHSRSGIPASHLWSVDDNFLRAIYGLGRPFGDVMVAADRSAWPAFVAAVPIAWTVAAVQRDRRDVRAAVTIAISEGAAAVASMGLKRLVRRPRPYVVMPSIEARSEPHRDGRARDPHSFPSGHAAISFSLATAVALESERWYVTVPVFVWASAVSTSRVWLGVHYPTDVLAGAALGGGVALLTYAIARSIAGDERDEGVGFVQTTFVHFSF